MIDIISILQEHEIPFWTEGVNVSPGWVNVQCPFCNDHSNHLGIHPKKEYCHCWKCGHHFFDDMLMKLLNINHHEAKSIMEEHNGYAYYYQNKEKQKTSNTNLSLPKGTTELKEIHKKYLIKRNYDPDELVKLWDIKGTYTIGDYAYRIIIPIKYENVLVSYQGRDFTNKSSLRYKACKTEDEIMHHKDLLYGIDHIKNRKAIIVEGVFDAWRLGYGAAATFGTSVTNAQILFMKKHLDYIFILFDPSDNQAQRKAKTIAEIVSGIGIKAALVELPDFKGKDPGDLKSDDAEYLRKFLLNY